MKLEEFLQQKYNYNPEIKDTIKGYIDQWKSWYKGNVRSFHNYFIYNGNKKVKQHRYTMNMAKEISEDWSDILWSEKCEISFVKEDSQKQFDKLIDELDLYSIINRALEKSGALGTTATVTSVYDILQNEDGMYLDVSQAKVRVDTVDVDWIYPLSWNNKEITECAFGSVEYVNGIKYVICSVHKLNDQGNYVIYNHLFKETNGNLSEITDEQGTMQEFDTKSNIKWFSVFKPLLTNNLFNNSPFGIPHYANAIDNMKAVDISFDALKNEIKDGRKRTFVRSDMFNYDNGTQKMVFDPEDTTVYQLPTGATKDDLIQSDSDLNIAFGKLMENIPHKSLQYIFSRILDSRIANRSAKNSNGTVNVNRSNLLNQIKNKYSTNYADYSTGIRPGSRLLYHVLNKHSIVIDGITYSISLEDQLHIIISGFLYSLRNDTAHGSSISTTKSSYSNMTTMANSYFAFLMTYYLLLLLIIDNASTNKPQALSDLTQNIEVNVNNYILLFGHALSK